MADLWFGLDATGFALACMIHTSLSVERMLIIELTATFHEYFGPLLMVAYTCLSNTLLLTSEALHVSNDPNC